MLIIKRCYWVGCAIAAFAALAELNAAIAELRRQLNEEPSIRRPGVTTRRVLLEKLDRPNLKRLPAEPYCFAERACPTVQAVG